MKTTKAKRRLSGPEVDDRYGVSAQTRWRWRKRTDLRFPLPFYIGRRPYWLEEDLEKFEQERLGQPNPFRPEPNKATPGA